MNDLYIANLVRKERFTDGIFICKTIGPVVGLLFGTHFLSSHSRKYIPLFYKDTSFSEKQCYISDMEFSENSIFNSSEYYAYCELKKIEDYDSMESYIQEYKKLYDHVCYYVDFTHGGVICIRYKEKSLT